MVRNDFLISMQVSTSPLDPQGRFRSAAEKELLNLLISLQVYHRDAGSAKLHVFVGIVGDVGNGGEILANELA